MHDYDIKTSLSSEFQFLSGGGEMGALIRAKDWSSTLVGTPDQWPQSLRTTLSLILNSRFPMFLFWGPHLVCFYNDAYRPRLGKDGKHPGILGSRAEDYWQEIWGNIKPIIDQVMSGGAANRSEDMYLPIYRNGKMEDVYWTFSYSPAFDESGKVAGVFVTCFETTEKINNYNNLKESKDQLHFAIDAAEMGTFDYNPITNKFIGNDRLKMWFGLQPEEEVDLKKATDAIIETDRQRVIDAINTALEYSSGGRYNIDYTIVHPVTKKETVVEAKGKVWFHDKMAYRLTCTLQDITEQGMVVKKIAESEQRFHAAIAAVDGILWTNNAKGEMEGEQPAWAKLTGQTYEEYQGYGWANAIHPDDAQPTIDAWNEALRKKKIFVFEHRVFMNNGHWGQFHVRAIPLINADGSIREWVGVHTDITDKRRSEMALQESERNLRSTIMQAAVAIAIFRGSNHVVEIVNDRALLLWGREREEVINKPLLESMPELQSQGIKEILDDVYNNGNTFSATELPVMMVRKKKVETAYVNFVYEPMYDNEGYINGIMAVGTDVSEQVVDRKKVEESEHNVRTIIENAPFPIGVYVGKEMRIQMANQSILNVWAKGNDVIGKLYADILPELENQQIFQQLAEVFATGKPFHAKNQRVDIVANEQLQSYYFNYSFTPLYDSSGNIYGIMNTAADVTDLNISRQKVENAEERLRLALVATELSTWDLDLQTGEIVHSPRLAEIFGHNKSKVITHKQMRSQIHPDDIHDIVETAFDLALKTGRYRYEARVVKPDTRICWIRVQGKVFYDEQGKPLKVIGTLRDITDEKQRQRELEESEQKFRLLAESMPQFIWTGDAEGNLNYFNEAVYEFSGMSKQEVAANGWINIVHPDDREENIKAWIQSITTGKDFLFEHRFRRYDGEYRWQLSRATPQRDETGAIQMWVGSSTDIQDIKEQDQQKDYFISLASHELKTPITSIKAYTQILQSTYSTGEDIFLKKSLGVIDKQIAKLTNLISDLLDVSKIKSGSLTLHRENFEINELIAEVIDEIKHINPEYNIVHAQKTIAYLYADRERIGQVLTNFLTNAVKYSPHSGIIEVGSIIENNNLIVSVEDFGIGINKNDQEKIFERFYRVEGRSEKTFPGFGIGLFISMEIIRRHKGEIGVNSEPGKGSVFYFSIPLGN